MHKITPFPTQTPPAEPPPDPRLVSATSILVNWWIEAGKPGLPKRVLAAPGPFTDEFLRQYYRSCGAPYGLSYAAFVESWRWAWDFEGGAR